MMPQELKGFTYATALDLNMGYYTIRLDPSASKICAIIFPWGKDLIRDCPWAAQPTYSEPSLEFVQVYMDNLLIIKRGILDKHLQKMETVLTRLREAGLKVNAAKSFFCAHEIEYLGYILTRDGSNPNQRKHRQYLY
jgi:hypothetical protein